MSADKRSNEGSSFFPLKDVILPFLIVAAIDITTGIAMHEFGIIGDTGEDYSGIVYSAEIAVIAGFSYCYSKCGKLNGALLRFSFMLLLCVAFFMFHQESRRIWGKDSPLKSWSGMLLWSGVILYILIDGVFEWLRNRRRKSCLYQIVAWNMRRGIETSEVLPIRADDGETYCIVRLDNEQQIAVNIDCRPTKQGYYKCAWVWDDPKNGKHYFLTPDNYKILFSFVTDEIEIQGLKDSNSQ